MVDSMVIVGVASQASCAVGVPNTGVSGQSMVVLGGQLIVGEVISRTVICWLHVLALLPQSSVARHIRVATYARQPVVGGGVVDSIVIVGVASQASCAVGVPNTGVSGQSMVVLGGQLIVGEVLSRTVICWLHVFALLPQSSVARHIRVAT